MLSWRDGQPFSARFGDVYFSDDSGLEEKCHVFLRGNNLPERFSALRCGDSFAIGEVGFGTGLNFLCAWRLFSETSPSSSSLDFFSIEKYPLSESELADALALWPALRPYTDELCTKWHRRVPGWNRWCFDGGRVRLTLVIGDVMDALTEVRGGIDAWFLDGFSPALNPEMWTPEVFESVVRASRPGASFSTYTCAGYVRRGLERAGFRVGRCPGFGRKREMLQGDLPGLPPPRPTVTSAIVIGGGVAGCAAAAALAMRGVPVILIEGEPTLAAAASGNPRGILHIRLSAGMGALQRFLLGAYGHVLALLDERLPVDGESRAECGELQLATSEPELRRIEKLAALDWPAHLMHRVDAAEASGFAGVKLEHGGLRFPAGCWVSPPRMCAALAASPLVTQHVGHRAESLTSVSGGWRVSGQDGDGRAWAYDAQVVVVCAGYQARSFAQLSHLPLTPVRGQITAIPETAYSERLQTIVCANGYIAPSARGLHLLGATHGFNDEAVDLRVPDHAENISKLAGMSAALAESLSMDAVAMGKLGGRASVRASLPGAMPLVGESLPGLYVSLGHGTHGLVTAGLSGELIAASVFRQLLPLPRTVVDELATVRGL